MELKPCPLCGADAKLIQHVVTITICCGANADNHSAYTFSVDRDKAIEIWNNRP